MGNIPVALQLYTVRDDIAKDFLGTHRRVAQIGYKNVELAGFNGKSPEEYKTILDDLGLKVVGTHEGLDGLQGEKLSKVVQTYKTMDCPYIAVPYLAEDRRKDEAGWRAVAKDLNEAGRRLKAEGFGFGYHNHAFEFDTKFGGKMGIEILLEETDPSLVGFELDTYWALFGGTNPVEFMAAHPGRFPLLHIKDMDASDRSFAPIGTGILPLDGIIEAAPKAGAKVLIVEQDSCKNAPLEAIKTSFDNLHSRGYV